MNEKKIVLLFNLFFFLLLLSATIWFGKRNRTGEYPIRPINILSDVRRDTTAVSKKASVAVTGHLQQIAAEKHIIIKDYTTSTDLINASGDRFALSRFYRKLYELKKRKRKKVRIAYFGDSMIEGDLITDEIRRQMQDTFGGSGVGFVPVTSIVAGFRKSVGHSFSSDWADVSFKSGDRSGADLFLSGHSFFGTEKSWVDYKTVKDPHLDNFSDISVLYGKPDSGKNHSGIITYNGTQQPFTACDSFNEFKIKYDSSRELKMSIAAPDVPFYGAAFESDSGVFIDNFSFRGITGVEFKYFTESFLKRIQATRPYDLLVFQYGPNLLFRPDLTTFDWYEKNMLPVLKKIKSAFPESSILIVSTADKSANYNGNWHTAKGVGPLIDVQYDMAQTVGADFLNLYLLMGGEGAMVNWVQGDTVYADKDYTHVNLRGGKRLGDLIFKTFMRTYNDFEKYIDQ